MGKLPWHMLGRLIALTAGTYVAWAGLWGLFYRKYFWDFVGGTLGPAGLVPPPQAKLFEDIIVTVPVLQIINIVNGLLTLALELPLTALRGSWVHSSFALRVGFYFSAALAAMFPYQTIDGGLYYAIAAGVYAEAIRRRETQPALVGKALI